MFARGFFAGFHLPRAVGRPARRPVSAAQGPHPGRRPRRRSAWRMYRWLVSHPARLFGFAPAENRLRGQSHGEALLILSFIGAIMICGFLYDGGHLYCAALTPEIERERAWQPLSALVGLLLFSVGGVGLGAVRQRRRLVDAQLHHPLLPEPAAAVEALPHHHLGPQRLLQEARADRRAQQAGSRERHDLRHLVHQPVHLEAGARHVLVHRVRPLLVALPGDDQRQDAGAAPAPAQPARLSVRARGATSCAANGAGDGATGSRRRSARTSSASA